MAVGLLSTACYYLYLKASKETDEPIVKGSKNDHSPGMQVKRALVNELRALPIDPPKDTDRCMTREFMVTLYQLLYKY